MLLSVHEEKESKPPAGPLTLLLPVQVSQLYQYSSQDCGLNFLSWLAQAGQGHSVLKHPIDDALLAHDCKAFPASCF